jgi:hypothetical protein
LSLNFIGNNIVYGISISSGSITNRITFNTFINNSDPLFQAYSAEESTIFSFNFWFDHLSPDVDKNGIIDTAYVIDGSCSCQDDTPVTVPYHKIVPIITVNSPTATFYNTNSVTLLYNVLVYCGSGTCITTIFIDDVANTTLIASGTLITGLTDGIHNITIVVTDGVGDTAKKDILFTVDTTGPTVNIDSPTATTYITGNISIALSGDADNFWYYIVGEDSINQSWTANISRLLADGTYTLHAYGNDSIGNEVHVSVTFIIKEMTIDENISNVILLPFFLLIIGVRGKRRNLESR